jgi:molecular chaperone DnaK
LDVTVLELFEGVVDVKSSCGNNQLGGKDFDEALMRHLVKKAQEKHKTNPLNDAYSANRLKTLARTCKVELSTETKYDLILPFLKDKHGKPVSLNEPVTRKDFEKLIAGLVQSTSEQLNTALSEAGLTKNDIDLVLLVGGSTRIPLVKEFLRNELDFEPQTFVDPDLAVVKGAAVQAGIIEGVFTEEDTIVLSDVCPYTLSFEVIDYNPFPVLVCDPLIPRNTTIPAQVTKGYQTSHDNQEEVEIRAFQGEGQYPAENMVLGNFMLRGLPPGPRGKESISVTFEYDLNGILNVSAVVDSNGMKGNMVVNVADKTRPVGALETAKPDKWLDAPNASKYRTIISRAERRIDSASDDDADTIEELKSAIEELKLGLVAQKDFDELEELKDEVLDLISDLS